MLTIISNHHAEMKLRYSETDTDGDRVINKTENTDSIESRVMHDPKVALPDKRKRELIFRECNSLASSSTLSFRLLFGLLS